MDAPICYTGTRDFVGQAFSLTPRLSVGLESPTYVPADPVPGRRTAARAELYRGSEGCQPESPSRIIGSGPAPDTQPGKAEDQVPDPAPRGRPPPDGQGRAGGDRPGLRLASGHQPGDGEPECPHDRPASGSCGLSPGQLVAGEVDDPGRPIVVGPSPQRLDESDRVVEVRLRPSRRRFRRIPLEERAE